MEHLGHMQVMMVQTPGYYLVHIQTHMDLLIILVLLVIYVVDQGGEIGFMMYLEVYM